MNIVLIGMPGCGKSTLGSFLSRRLNLRFIDLDEYIENKQEKTIKEIFNNGEDYFRDIETEVVKEVSIFNSTIISTGGGVVKRYENILQLKKNSIMIFINRPIEEILKDIDCESRPLLKKGKEKLYRLYEERLPLYKKYCDVEILNDKHIDLVLGDIIKLLKRKEII